MQVLTENGFKNFEGVRRTYSTNLYRILTKCGRSLVCTPEHKIKTITGFVEVSQLKKDTMLSVFDSVISIEKIDDKQYVYDLVNVADGSEYLTNGITSHNCDILALDEFALIRWSIADTFFSTTMPVLSSRKNSKAIIVSTPRGTVNNKYYDIWMAANSNEQDAKNKDGWVPFRIDWWDVPGRDEDWKNARIAEMGIEKFRQEFGCEFSSSGTSLLIPDECIHKYRKALSTFPDPVEINLCDDPTRPAVNVDVWKNYDPSKVYCAMADVSEGTGNDASVLYIMDVTNFKQGISIDARISSSSVSVLEFANATSKVLYNYNWPTLIVENNGVGAGYIDALMYTFNVPADKIFSERNASGVVRYGIHSTNAVKLEACLFARELMTTDEINFILRDKLLINEMGTFIRRANSGSITYAASGSTHDDHIMAFIWGLYLFHYKNIEKYFSVESAFKTNKGQILPEQLDCYVIGNVDEIQNSDLYKTIDALLKGTAIEDDGSPKFSLNVNPEDGEPLYYGAAGRGGAFINKPYYISSDSYSRFDSVDFDDSAEEWDGVSGLWDDRPPEMRNN